jgi:dihydroorotase
MEPNRKTANDRKVLWEALLDGRIDVIATDHAPHTLDEKQSYLKAPSGGPLVQHAVAMFEAYHQGKISIEKIVEKCVITRLKFSKCVALSEKVIMPI